MNDINVFSFIKQKPHAVAKIQGSSYYPKTKGMVKFYQTKEGVIVSCEISRLPVSEDVCKEPIFAIHIHEGGSCSGNAKDFFANAGSHYNPKGCPHPYHAGDLPPLFGVNGFAFSMFLTNRFTAEEIIGKTVIIHSAPDDFTSQPSGNSGMKIACGVIM